MKPQSAKAKGRKLQQWVRDQVLSNHPDLEPDDVKSTSMGAGDEDIQLSPAARREFPYSVECKARKSLKTIYDFYQQAVENAGNSEPILVIRQDRSKPLLVIDAEYFLALTGKPDKANG